LESGGASGDDGKRIVSAAVDHPGRISRTGWRRESDSGDQARLKSQSSRATEARLERTDCGGLLLHHSGGAIVSVIAWGYVRFGSLAEG